MVEAGAVVEREASVLEGKRLALVLHGQDENMRGSTVYFLIKTAQKSLLLLLREDLVRVGGRKSPHVDRTM